MGSYTGKMMDLISYKTLKTIYGTNVQTKESEEMNLWGTVQQISHFYRAEHCHKRREQLDKSLID